MFLVIFEHFADQSFSDSQPGFLHSLQDAPHLEKISPFKSILDEITTRSICKKFHLVAIFKRLGDLKQL